MKINGHKYNTIPIIGDGHFGLHCLAFGLDYMGSFRKYAPALISYVTKENLKNAHDM